MKRCQGCDAAVEGTDPHTACVMCLGETHALAALTKVTCTACAALGAQELLRRASMHREDASWADFPEPFAMHSQEDRPNLRDGRVPSDTAHLEEALLTLANSSGDEDDDLLLHSSADATNNLAILAIAQTNLIESLTSSLADDVSAELRKNAGAILHLTQGWHQRLVISQSKGAFFPDIQAVLESSPAQNRSRPGLYVGLSQISTRSLAQIRPRPHLRAGLLQIQKPVKDGGVRPILDLRALNRHLVKRRFQMLTHKRVMSSISQGDWFTLVDLKDAYFHVNIERIASLRGHACRFLPGRCISGITIMRLLGLMAAAIAVVPLGLLRMRPVQLWLKRMHFDPMRDRAKLFRIPQSVVRALSHWRDGRMLSVGVPMGAISTHVPVYTDASTKGWGAVCNGMMASGLWNPPLPHINVLEITAVWLALQRFEPLLRGRHVLIRSDNKVTVAYVNRQGGTKCPHLHRLAVRIWTWAYPRVRSLRALYVPGQLNCGADLLSRGGPSPLEWCLHPLVVAEVWSRFGKARVDLFASRQNAHCPLWFAMTATGSPPLGVDALAHCWPKGLLYAFPPFGLVPQVLAKAREERKPLILIAPDWPHKQWMADVALLLTDVPWRLPQRRDLLSQGAGTIFHPHPSRLRLTAWPLLGAGS
ncbi:uncharacterized protein LOC133111938 [Conger conger]|uniref:uncharacterized protein LOC133111938 n=1 Tax=Conger conger TaxID=82655 RepID=UPI002A5B0801|nr:uncharacterized protein LOC133111938 [Conger conger]